MTVADDGTLLLAETLDLEAHISAQPAPTVIEDGPVLRAHRAMTSSH